jgi:hypothetical protein
MRTRTESKRLLSGGQHRTFPNALGSTSGSDSFTQEEVFEDKVSFPSSERTATGTACYLARVCLRTGFDFDDLIKCLAVRAREQRSNGHDRPDMQTDGLNLK